MNIGSFVLLFSLGHAVISLKCVENGERKQMAQVTDLLYRMGDSTCDLKGFRTLHTILRKYRVLTRRLMEKEIKPKRCPPCPNRECSVNVQPVSKCPSGWDMFKRHCYFFGKESISWTDAKKRCLKENANLVKIEDNTENNWLKAKARASNNIKLWIGANDLQTEGHFKWEAGNSKLTFSDWSPGQPDNGSRTEHCAQLHKSFNWRWNDDQCYNKFKYICEKNVK